MSLTGAAEGAYERCDYDRAIDLISGGEIDVESLVSRHFPLEQFADAYRYIDAHPEEVMKIVIDL